MYDPSSTGLSVEMINPKDQYETPAHVWRYAIAEYALDYDLHASSLNALLPTYGARGTTTKMNESYSDVIVMNVNHHDIKCFSPNNVFTTHGSK